MAGSANLGKHLEDYVDELVNTGRYGSRDDVLREGLRLLQIKERRLAELDAAIEHGLADAEVATTKMSKAASATDSLGHRLRWAPP